MADEVKDPVVPATFTQEQVDAMIAEKVAGLKANKNDILDEKKAVVAENKTLIEQYEAQRKASAEATRKALVDKGDLDEIQAAIKSDLSKEYDDIIAELKATNTSLLTDNYNSTTDALLGSFVSTLGVSPIQAEAFDAFIKGKGLKHEDGVLTIGGYSLDDWKTTFLTSEYGKSIIVPPQSSGGDSLGGGSSANETSIFSQMESAGGSSAMEIALANQNK